MAFERPEPSTQEEKDILEEHKKNAKERPEKRMNKLLAYADKYLNKHEELYIKRKAAYDKKMDAYKKNPTKLHAPKPDSFVVNYEEAMALKNRIIKSRNLESIKNPGFILASYSEGAEQTKGPSLEAKKMANMLAFRTFMPPYPIVSNVVIKGVRYMMFAPGPKGANRMTQYPDGRIKVISNGKEPHEYLPPFPDVHIEHKQDV